MRNFKQLLEDFKNHLTTNDSVREFLLFEITEEEFLFFKMMFFDHKIPQKYHEMQTEFFFWWSSYYSYDNEDEALQSYDQCCQSFHDHLNVISEIYIGGYKLDGDASKNIDTYDLIEASPLGNSICLN